ncbi:LpxD UDP-3-O-[3-hydroxymyristoyl] [Candidatus Pelagibacterales bacterium]
MNKIFFKKSKKFIFVKDIFSICNYSERKFYNQKIFGVNNVQDAKVGDVTFFNDLKYENDIKITKASACIVNKNLVKFLNKNTIPVISQNPLLDFYKVVSVFYPDSSTDKEKIITSNKKNQFSKKNILIGENTLIDKTVKIGKDTEIGNNVIIKHGVHIGKNCKIGSNVIIENALMGDNIIIKSGTLIGQTGFGFNFEKKKRIKFPHIGRVIIENDVLIGSFCTIDRGSLTDTVIGEFTSIDNQVQIAHNVKIGSFCMIAAQSGIAGSTVIGNNVQIGGQTGISGHLSIGNNVKIGGKSGVISDINDNQTVMGYPAKSIREFLTNKK